MGLVILYMYSVSSSWVPSRSTTSSSSISNEGSHLQVRDRWEIGGGGYRTTCYLLLATCYLREQPIEALAEGAVVAKDRVGHRGRSEQTAHLEGRVYTVYTPCIADHYSVHGLVHYAVHHSGVQWTVCHRIRYSCEVHD